MDSGGLKGRNTPGGGAEPSLPLKRVSKSIESREFNTFQGWHRTSVRTFAISVSVLGSLVLLRSAIKHIIRLQISDPPAKLKNAKFVYKNLVHLTQSHVRDL